MLNNWTFSRAVPSRILDYFLGSLLKSFFFFENWIWLEAKYIFFLLCFPVVVQFTGKWLLCSCIWSFAVSLNDYKFDQRLKRITIDDVFFHTLNNDSRSQASTLGIDYPGTEPWTRPTLPQNKKSRKRRSTSQTKTKSLVKEKKKSQKLAENIHDKEDSAIIQLQKSRRRKRSTKCIVTDDEQVASSVTNTEPCTALSEDSRSNPKAKRTRRSRKSTRVAETPSFQRELSTAVDIRPTGQLKSSSLSSTSQLKSSSSINIPPDTVLKTKRKYSRRKRTTNFVSIWWAGLTWHNLYLTHVLTNASLFLRTGNS